MPDIFKIDAHVHVFTSDMPLIDNPRHAPTYSFTHQELIATLDVRVDPRALMRVPTGRELRAWAENVRREGLVSIIASGEQRAVLARSQSLMAVLEGYSEHVMDAVGARLLETLPELRAAMERRRRSRSAPERVLQRLIGLDLKIRQYELGKHFCDGAAASGEEVVNPECDAGRRVDEAAFLEHALTLELCVVRLGV